MIKASENVSLPVGLEIDGKRYKNLTIHEMNGYDEENLSSKKVRNNGGKGQTLLLRRCIQSIEGLLEKKANSNALIKEEYVTGMTAYDRDYLFYCIRVLGGIEQVEFEFECDRCGNAQLEEISFTDLEVYDWPEDEPLEIPFELPRGIFEGDRYYAKGKWKFVTGKQQEQLSRMPEDRIVNASLRLCAQLDEMDSAATEEQFKGLSMTERSSLLQQVSEEAPGVQNSLEIICEECDKTTTQMVDVSRFFRSATGASKTQSGNATRRRRKRT